MATIPPYTNRKYPGFKNIIWFAFLGFLLIFPGVFNRIYIGDPVISVIKHMAFCSLFLFIPLVLFYRNIKIYLYLLAVFALCVPMICFSVYFFGLYDMSIITTLIFQTNFQEATELGRGLGIPFILITFLYTGLYLFGVRKTSVKKIPFLIAFVVSLCSAGLVWKRISSKVKHLEEPYVMVLDRYYPASVVSSLVNVFNDPFEPKAVDRFSFHARRADSLKQRRIFVFIIGESAPYYHWQINGYTRATSPRLPGVKNLISFSDVVSGAHYTAISVPQMITRATPDNMNIQYKEKSILAAFKEAGYKTVWLSNQHPNYWVSTIVPHAMRADIHFFPDSKGLDQSPYDGRFLPVLDSIIRHTSQDLFIVFHTMGSHWDYSERYPSSFNYFKPSGKDVRIDRFTSDVRQAIINSYDNSILYTDFIIDTTIQIVNKYEALSYVAYLADHGEDVYDSDSTIWYSHNKASAYTLHVPLFIWTSDQYDSVYPFKRGAMLKHRNQKIGGDNIFYTLMDMAGITYSGFDFTKSIVSDSFRASPQKYIEPNDSKAKFYSTLRATAAAD